VFYIVIEPVCTSKFDNLTINILILEEMGVFVTLKEFGYREKEYFCP